MDGKRCEKGIQQARGNALTQSLAGQVVMRWRGDDGGVGRVGYGVSGLVGGVWDDGVNGQRKTRCDDMECRSG